MSGQVQRAVAGEGDAPGSIASGPSRRRLDDGLGGVVHTLALGARSVPGGFGSWIAVGLLAHVLLLGWAWAQSSVAQMQAIVKEMREVQRAAFQLDDLVDIEPEKKAEPPPKAPEPEPEPEPEPAPAPVPQAKAEPPPPTDPYDPPPAAGAATKVLTADDDPVDMTGQGFVSGDGSGPGYGQVAGDGTAKAPTYNPSAAVGGVPTGTGKGPPVPPPAPTGPDLSRSPGLAGGTSWSGCPFPAEADADQIDEAVAVVMVTVRPDGSPLAARVITDPGHGFGRQARICALGKRYSVGLDRAGTAITATTPPIRIRFTR